MSMEHGRPTGDDDRLGNDLLKGGPAIAAFGGWSLREVYHLIERGLLPVTRAGRRIYARKSELRARFSSSGGSHK
jgi:hypothetical protein